MLFKTQEFSRLIKDDIKKGDIQRAIKLLVEAIPEKSPYQKKAIILSGQFNQLYERELLGFGRENENLAMITNSILILLKQLEENYPNEIDLRVAPLKNKIEPINRSKKNKKKKDNKDKWSNPLVDRLGLNKRVIQIPTIIIISITTLIFIGKYWSSIPTSEDNLQAKIGRSIKEKEELIKNTKINTSNWSILLDVFDEYDKANLLQKKYPNREIEILKIGNQFWAIKLNQGSLPNAKKKANRLKKYWKDAKTINLVKYCSNISWEEGLNFLECK